MQQKCFINVLRHLALETIHTIYPPEECIHVYTNGSSTDFESGARAGGISSLFLFYSYARRTLNFYGEVFAILTAIKAY